jgi:uncharacterized protein YaiE (UPF0345 family)
MIGGRKVMIIVNEYFEGNVKSLGFEFDNNPCTAGVILPGDYAFDTEKEEHITITVGAFKICPPGADWKTVRMGDTIVIPPNSSFDVKVDQPASYVCLYKQA